MPSVTIKIQESPLGGVTEVKVTKSTTAAALASALAAVTPQIHAQWSEIIRAARLVQAAKGGASRSASAARPGARTAGALASVRWTAGRVPTVPLFPPGVAAKIAADFARAFEPLTRVLRGLSAGSPVHPVLPSDPSGPAALIVLPAEAMDWKQAHPEGPILHPGTNLMTVEQATRFLSWRAARTHPLWPTIEAAAQKLAESKRAAGSSDASGTGPETV